MINSLQKPSFCASFPLKSVLTGTGLAAVIFLSKTFHENFYLARYDQTESLSTKHAVDYVPGLKAYQEAQCSTSSYLLPGYEETEEQKSAARAFNFGESGSCIPGDKTLFFEAKVEELDYRLGCFASGILNGTINEEPFPPEDYTESNPCGGMSVKAEIWPYLFKNRVYVEQFFYDDDFFTNETSKVAPMSTEPDLSDDYNTSKKSSLPTA